MSDSKNNLFGIFDNEPSQLGITKEYNKENRAELWDSEKGKSDFKNKQFGNKQTMLDEITLKVLHKSQLAAKNKYHQKNSAGEKISTAWANHAAETDHINAIKDVHDVAKYNPFLTDEDLKEVVNSEFNYRILPKSLNASKGEKNDWEIIADPSYDIPLKGKAKMASEKIRADTLMHANFAARTAKNAGGEFAKGATHSLVDNVIPLTVEAVGNLIDVAQGEKTLAEAGKKTGKAVLEVAVIGGTNQLLGGVLGKNEIAQITQVALVVKDSAVKYVNGEITEKEFFEEVGNKGATMVAGMIGGTIGKELGFWVGATLGSAIAPGAGTVVGVVVGEKVGQFLGSIIATVACSAIITAKDILKHMDDYKLKEAEFARLVNHAITEIDNQREKLKVIIEEENSEWNKTVDESFKIIYNGLTSSDNMDDSFAEITKGLDKIMGMFNSSAMFHSIEEYDAQLNDTLVF